MYMEALGKGKGTLARGTKIICMRIAGETYGIEIDYVDGVIRMGQERAILPSALPHLKGIMSLRGEVIPILDLSRMFGIGEISSDISEKRGVLIKVGRDKNPFCIIADEVFISGDFSYEAISRSFAPEVGVKYKEVIKGVVKDERRGEELIIVLDPIKILEKHQELSGIKEEVEEKEREKIK